MSQKKDVERCKVTQESADTERYNAKTERIKAYAQLATAIAKAISYLIIL